MCGMLRINPVGLGAGFQSLPKLGCFVSSKCLKTEAVNGMMLPCLCIGAVNAFEGQQQRQHLTSLEVFSIANVGPKVTGLPMVIFMSPRVASHGPRIKVSKKYGDSVIPGNWFVITVEDDPLVIGNPDPIEKVDIDLVKDWVLDVIVKYWQQSPPYEP